MPVEGKAELSRIVVGRFQSHTTPRKTRWRLNCSFSKHSGRQTKLFSCWEKVFFKKLVGSSFSTISRMVPVLQGSPQTCCGPWGHLRTRFCRPNVRRMYPENNPNNNLQHSFHHKHKSGPDNGPPRQNTSRSRSIITQFSNSLKIIREAP